MFRWLQIPLALLLAATSLHALAIPSFDRSAWQADYANLKQALEHDYANLAWMGSTQSGIDLPALDRQTRRALETAENNAQAEQAIRSFVAGLHDGHLSFLGTLAQGKVAPEPPTPSLATLDATAGCAALGFNPNGQMGFSLPFESLPGFHLLSDGSDQPLRTALLDLPQGPRIGLLRLTEFEVNAYPGLCRQQWQTVRQGMSDNARQAELTQALAQAIAATLRGFTAAKVDIVIVDVGNNPGGDDSGDVFTRLFTAIPLHSAALLVNQSPSGSKYLDEQLDRLNDALQHHAPPPSARRLLLQAINHLQASKASIAGGHCDLAWVWDVRGDWTTLPCRRLVSAGSSGGPLAYLAADAVADLTIAHRLNWAQDVRADWGAWDGPLYVLTDGRTYSSAELFTARLHDNGAARTVGVRTGGDGCGSMVHTPPITLRHSQLRIRMPNCVRLRADGSDEVTGIAPDLPVLPLQGESTRARAWRLLQVVATDWRTHHGK